VSQSCLQGPEEVAGRRSGEHGNGQRDPNVVVSHRQRFFGPERTLERSACFPGHSFEIEPEPLDGIVVRNHEGALDNSIDAGVVGRHRNDACFPV
jgi:hypothetical protein